MMSDAASFRVSGGCRWALAGAAVLATVLAGCAAQAAPSLAPKPRPTPTPAPTATPLPGTPLPEAYRPEGDWTVTFALPGDFITETWRVVLTCPKGACDAVVEMRDAKGKGRGRAELALQDGRYVMRTTTTATVDCTAAGAKVKGGATRRTETDVVLATYRLAGTAIDQRTIQGRRRVTLEPQSGSGCARATLVYPASGELADR
jgi:hypothetical protein